MSFSKKCYKTAALVFWQTLIACPLPKLVKLPTFFMVPAGKAEMRMTGWLSFPPCSDQFLGDDISLCGRSWQQRMLIVQGMINVAHSKVPTKLCKYFAWTVSVYLIALENCRDVLLAMSRAYVCMFWPFIKNTHIHIHISVNMPSATSNRTSD